MGDQILPEFQKFLIVKNIVPKKNVPYYAYWVSRFLSFSNNNNDILLNLRICQFLEKLREDQKISDWQVQQADTAINVYLNNYLEGDVSIFYPEKKKAQKKDSLEFYQEYKDIVHKMREALRLRHYAYRTEQSYLDWVKKFYHYVNNTRGDSEKFGFDSKRVKDFLSHLAINKKVAASTQTQAFNALLFLFKNVLNIDLEDISNTVRAKRGIKLPVVLGVDEVEALFKEIEGASLLMLQLLYGSGMRIMELVRLRVQDIDFESNLIIVRSGKGDKDRATMLPKTLKTDLYLHLEKVKALHEEDLHAGYGW
jgi:hypothetical protein